MIKSENGLLRSYVQLTVSGRDEVGFVEEARRVVAERVKLPPGMYVEWSGQFENELKTRKTCMIVFPAVIAVIVLILYLTYKSWIDAVPDDDERARGTRRRGDLPVALRVQLQRRGLGRLHRLLRHGDGDGHRDARLPARGRRRSGAAWRASGRSPSCARRS